MTADSIARLSRKLLASPLANKGRVWLSSEDYEEQLNVVELETRSRLATFFQELRELVPTDFSFVAIFTFQGVELSFEFEDGNTVSSVPELYFFTSYKSLRKNLRRLPWDEFRSDAIAGGGVFDDLLSAAEDRPVNIHSSEAAAAACREELDDEIARVRAASSLPAFALIVRQSGSMDTMNFQSRDKVVFTIADCLATSCEILAVLECGVLWSFPELEEAKREAIEQLGPISRAKAEGRFLV